MKVFLTIIGILMAGVIFVLGWLWQNQDKQPETIGSVMRGGEYQSFVMNSETTTTSPTVIKASRGALGSVIITETGGAMTFYDATTTDLTKRDSSMTTSTISMATFPTGTAVGTYVFDQLFFNGLTLHFTAAPATTTITYR